MGVGVGDVGGLMVGRWKDNWVMGVRVVGGGGLGLVCKLIWVVGGE